MNISNAGTYLKAVIKVEVEGYFVERFINLCKINNIDIWNIKHITSGKISFEMPAKKYISIKKYVKKTKCKSNIVDKKGIYFDIFRYRKRRIAIYLSMAFLLLLFVLSTFIWKINIIGAETIQPSEINKILKEANIKTGMNKFFVSKSKIADTLRAKNYDIAWAGVEINGINLDIRIVEKTKEEIKDNSIGNIVAKKSGLLTKIVAIDGTAKIKTGSYVEKGMVLIEGLISSEFIEPKKVQARGITLALTDYVFKEELRYIEKVKEKTNKKRYSIGFSVNNKNFDLKCLPKENKYDITVAVKNFTLFGQKISIFMNTYEEYIENDIKNTYDELVAKALSKASLYQEKNFDNLNLKVVEKTENITKEEDKIIVEVKYKVEEDIGEFQKTGES